ncbi:MAG: 3-isopropylmalate dehydratase large subunit [bacterium]|nr:3-isopropylmalate dehydratase large subunit [bacterium]
MKKRKKIPTKTELLQLQKLYKTDERIGERLGGVPAYLVAYWRRKKNIPKYSLPKFSEKEIRNLWERYGDDEKSGLELGISKAAFYNWRRRYGIREKPAFLKLEQLELNFPGSQQPAHVSSLYGKRSVVQKILAGLAEAERVEVGEELEVEPDLVLSPGGAGSVVEHFKKKSAEFVWNPNKIVLTLDHKHTHNGTNPASAHKMIREFARRQGIKSFYDLREGTGHQLVIEKGLVLPGQLLVGPVSQVAGYGAMATFASGADSESLAGIWETGKIAMKVPETARIVVSGRRYRGVYAVDVALSIVKQLGPGALEGKVIEYAGSAISQMTIGERYALSSLSHETGALAAVCAYDATTRRYLTGRTMTRFQPVMPDKDAEYNEIYQVNIDQLPPQIEKRGEDRQVKALAEVDGLTVHQIILGTCTAGRFEDLRVAADVLKGRQVHADCRLIIIPGSRSVYLEALKKGLIRVFIEAGAVVMYPGCYPGTMETSGFLAAGERCLTTAGRPPVALSEVEESEVYFCSPATAAASALHGVITDPTRFVR